MAPVQGYHYNRMQVGNSLKSRPSRKGIRAQLEVHILVCYEKQDWNKRVESNGQLLETRVRLTSAPPFNEKTRGFRSWVFYL